MSAQIYDQAATTAEAIQHLYQNVQSVLHADVMFCSEEENVMFGAHKLVAGMRSPVLADLLYESNEFKYVKIKGVSVRAISNMISCFYDGDIAFENIYDIIDTLKLAKIYQFQVLEKRCKSKLIDFRVDVFNVLSVLETSFSANVKSKELECLTLIAENKDIIFKSEKFLKLKFENALEIFECLKKNGLITDGVFLLSAIRWMMFNKCVNKKKSLLQKVEFNNISAEEFASITNNFPRFFNSDEMTGAWNEIVNGVKYDIREDISSYICENGWNVEFVITEPKTASEDCDSGRNTSVSCSVGTNTELGTEEDYLEKEYSPGKIKYLKFRVLKDGPNEFNWIKRVKITIVDDDGERDIKIPLEVNENEALNRMFKERDEHDFYDVDMSYTGLLYYLKLDGTEKLSPTPTEYIEILKAALFLEDKRRFDEILSKLRIIEECDPVFLDGLRRISDLEGRCMHLLKSKTEEVLLHQNFLKSSSKLMDLLLQQDKLHLSKEVLLLKYTISWLKSPINERLSFRSRFLKKIAFENVSENDFRYAVVGSMPAFFSPEETKTIFAYKKAKGDESLSLRKKLPRWYSFKSRKLLNLN